MRKRATKILFLCFLQTVCTFDVPELPDRVENFKVLVGNEVLESAVSFETFCPNSRNFKNCETSKCVRHVEDNFVTSEEIKILQEMMKKGMKSSELTLKEGGPTILDINSGFMKDSEGLTNIYKPHRGAKAIAFTKEEYKIYGDLFDKIKNRIKQVFEIEELYFTAPTFVARIIGKEDWQPRDIHDEYFHSHVDQMNTPHYFYSGLLYLKDYENDFSGGEFLFLDPKEDSNDFSFSAILPKKGRFVTFSSGQENLHKVNKVVSGERLTLSMWFTCDKRKEFSTFLDGKVHSHFKTEL